jgi:uncharacterized peroxidase-related enzyme
VTHHAEGLRVLTKDEELIKHLSEDFRNADLNPADRAMLDYAAKLTREHWTIVEADVASLREAGFSDSALLDINQVTGYFAFVNRLADGLGVKLEHYWDVDKGPE